MTLAKAQSCLSAIVGAGFDARAVMNAAGDWIVVAQVHSGLNSKITLAQATNLATTQNVVGQITEVEFS